VLQVLVQREAETNVYRTRIAANVLCQWASRESGKSIAPYHPDFVNSDLQTAPPARQFVQ
jgi:hypothetical protein